MKISTFHQSRVFALATTSAAAWLLVACGGSDTAAVPVSSTPVLSGLAATGAAIANASVTAKCLSGAPVVGTTAADGSFTLSLSGGQTAPCMLEVVGGSANVTLHSFASEAGRVNITPLTELVLAKGLAMDPALGFASFDTNKANLINSTLDAAKNYVKTQISTITGSAPTADIMNGVFSVGSADDKVLDSLGAAIATAGKKLADLKLGAMQGSSLQMIVPSPSTTPITPTTPTVTTPTVLPVASSNECAPLLPKAGDSLTYVTTSTPSNSSMTTKYDYASSTYQGKSVLALTVTSSVNASNTSGVTYLDPATGTYLGASDTNTTSTTYDPPDYQDRINRAIYSVGQVASVAVKARITGQNISTAFAPIGGGTALTMDYTYTVERKPNEVLTTGAGSFANACKLQINVTVANVALEGNNGSNPLYSTLFGTIAGAFNQPFKTTVWLSNQLPYSPKAFLDASSSYGAATSTQELSRYTLAPR